MADDDDERLRVRRGSEHVRIKGTTEEWGEIIPAPVIAEPPGRSGDDEPEGAEHVEVDDPEALRP